KDMDVLDDAAMNAGAPQFRPIAVKTRQQLDARCLGGPQRRNPLFRQVALVVECPGISEVARRIQFGEKSQPLSIAEQVQGRNSGRVLLAVEAHAETGADLNYLVRRHDLFGFDINFLPDVARTLQSQNSFRSYVGRDQDFAAIPELK